LLESSNKTALITGASSGLGAEFAGQLAAKGFDLILVARREERLRPLGDALQSKYGITTTLLPADLSIIADIEKVIHIIEQTSKIELLINNAGFGTVGRFSHVELEKELAMLHVHMVAPVLLCRAILPGMTSRNKGAIINVSSLAGILPIRNVMYGSSKSFLISFSEALQDELRDNEIHVQALCPGFILTEFHDTDEYTKFSRSSIPRFLWMTPEVVVSESLKSLNKHAVICIPGNLYKIVGALARNSITAGLIKSAARFVLRRRKH
jgi:short-subunit dehydrogenase